MFYVGQNLGEILNNLEEVQLSSYSLVVTSKAKAIFARVLFHPEIFIISYKNCITSYYV